MLNAFDQAYHQLCEEILEIGKQKNDRTNTGTISKFGHQLRFDLSKGFPLLTTKKVSFKLIATYGLSKEIQILSIYFNIITTFGMSGHSKNLFNPKTITDPT